MKTECTPLYRLYYWCKFSKSWVFSRVSYSMIGVKAYRAEMRAHGHATAVEYL